MPFLPLHLIDLSSRISKYSSIHLIRMRVYVGNLDDDTTVFDLKRAFMKFGKIEDVWISDQPKGFAFVTFKDCRDADDAVYELDGTILLKGGKAIKVEIAKKGIEEIYNARDDVKEREESEEGGDEKKESKRGRSSKRREDDEEYERSIRKRRRSRSRSRDNR